MKLGVLKARLVGEKHERQIEKIPETEFFQGDQYEINDVGLYDICKLCGCQFAMYGYGRRNKLNYCPFCGAAKKRDRCYA